MNQDKKKEPRIIVDEDWKTQVQAEKEALEELKQEKKKEKKTTGEPDQPQDDIAPPPASFSVLATTLAAQAMAALGHIPRPDEKEPMVRLDLAKHYIDTLGILEEKTKGNLSPEESELLGGLLHEVRMAFVASHKAPPAEPPK